MNPGKAFTHVKTLAKLFILLGVILVFNCQPAEAETLQQAYDCSTQTDIPQSECEALVALYNSTNGSGWIDSTDWLKTTSPCGWAGVTCGSGAVTALKLNGNNLVGVIPGTIDSLSKLTLLDLSGNKLSGALPGEIGNIAPLLTLNISTNPGLTGSLPLNLTNLAALTTFDYSGTGLCESQDGAFKAWITGVASGGVVSKSGILCFQNCVSQSSVSIEECNALITFYGFTTGDSWTDNTNWQYSDDVCTWYGVTCGGKAVTALDLPSNNLVGVIPLEITYLSNLTQLNLSNNNLSGGLPEEIAIATLISLNISSNPGLTGALPASMPKMSALTSFDFSGTDLCEPQDGVFQTWLSGIAVTDSGIDCSINCALQTSVPQTECEALISLYYSTSGDSWTNKTNWLSAMDVCSWYGVTCDKGTVSELILNSNNLNGSIPVEIGDLTNLVFLGLNGNQLSGGIPFEIGSLTNLQILDFSGNQLSGALPKEIGNLTNLSVLDIGNNSMLTGALPSTLTNLTKLNEFYFNGTDLCVPQDAIFQSWLGSISMVTSSGIPCFDCAAQSSVSQIECEALKALYISTNGDNWSDHSGWFLSDVCSWYGVTCYGGHVITIDLTYNNLTGTIPPDICDFPYLLGLYLGGSPISGSLPVELGNLASLIELFIYETNISGGLPPSLGNLANLQSLWILDNQIDGSIPASIGDLSNLSFLVLVRNQLSGNLPPELGKLANLNGLGLSDNNLSGTLPPKLGSLVNLEILDLDNNNFSGALPPELGNLTLLQYLYIADNNFTGEIPGTFVNLINLLEFHNANNALCMPNNNTALINWYQALDYASIIYSCNPVTYTSTPKPTATSSGGGGGTAPTSTSLPTSTPTITFTPTITLTPTLVWPLQTLTQMAIEDTQAADPSNGLQTATTAASATLYYFYQQGTETVEPGALSDANGGSGLVSEDDSSEGQSDIDVAGTQPGIFIPPLAVWFAIIMAVIIIIGILIFDRRKRKKDPTQPVQNKDGFQTYQ